VSSQSKPKTPEFWEAVELSGLDIDDSYQRDLVDSRVERMVTYWDANAAGSLILSARDRGKTMVIDGWHRVNAGKLKGITHLPAIVMFGLTVAQEAALFHAYNNDRYAVSPIDLFHARVTAQDPDAIAILRICHEQEVDISNVGRSDSDVIRRSGGWGNVSAVRALEDAHGWGGLEPTLYVLKSGYPNSSGAFKAQPILAVASLYKNFGAVLDTERLIKTLQATALVVFEQAAQGMKAGLGGSIWPHLAQVILHEYNTGLKGDRRLTGYQRPMRLRLHKFGLNRG
jgi:hypothetical protein